MSDLTSIILFEHPLNEKMRTWLRIEFLLQQLESQCSLDNIATALTFFRTTSDLIDVLERGEVRTDLLKELERQQQKLQQWADMPGVDMALIDSLRSKLKKHSTVLMSAPRIGQLLKEDRLINVVRQRLSIPGGCCSFDLPVLHTWLHQPQEQCNQHISRLLASLAPLNQSLTIILNLIRQSSPLREQISLNGFFQDNAESADLLRLRLPLDLQLYPQVSGHKTRYAIRFLPLDSENGTVPARLSFELACC